ncbi:hypothetical protein AK812_SmicGene5795 [Symbiodinium microadriaticum]|uniref:Uncharacterized protein n=1 Tax=Symbiodinium microadriaticum TaxID=2951 RepID=A0A1Q9ESS4_SYMMI|nr:hypothetical protein AK812_SmicGene5795 [Symbiodinium microadriaticum]
MLPLRCNASTVVMARYLLLELVPQAQYAAAEAALKAGEVGHVCMTLLHVKQRYIFWEAKNQCPSRKGGPDRDLSCGRDRRSFDAGDLHIKLSARDEILLGSVDNPEGPVMAKTDGSTSKEAAAASAGAGVNAKARANLLSGLKDGSLDKLVSNMPDEGKTSTESSGTKAAAGAAAGDTPDKGKSNADSSASKEAAAASAGAGVNAKARANLLSGLKDGSLDKLVSNMPDEGKTSTESSGTKAAAGAAAGDTPDKGKSNADSSASKEAAAASAGAGVNAKARANLLSGLKDGSLDKLVSNMPDEGKTSTESSGTKAAAGAAAGDTPDKGKSNADSSASKEAAAASAGAGVNAKARANLLSGLKDGSLDKLVSNMPDEGKTSTESSGTKAAAGAAAGDTPDKGKSNADSSASKEAAAASAGAGVNAKARANLLSGLKDGSLDKLVSNMPDEGKTSTESSGTKAAAGAAAGDTPDKGKSNADSSASKEAAAASAGAGVNAKARANLLSGLKDGSLDKLVSNMPDEGKTSTESSGTKAAAGAAAGDTPDKGKSNADSSASKEAAAASAGAGVNAKARANLLSGLKDGSLDKLVSNMPDEGKTSTESSGTKAAAGAAAGDTPDKGKSNPDSSGGMAAAGPDAGAKVPADNRLPRVFGDGAAGSIPATSPGDAKVRLAPGVTTDQSETGGISPTATSPRGSGDNGEPAEPKQDLRSLRRKTRQSRFQQVFLQKPDKRESVQSRASGARSSNPDETQTQ